MLFLYQLMNCFIFLNDLLSLIDCPILNRLVFESLIKFKFFYQSTSPEEFIESH